MASKSGQEAASAQQVEDLLDAVDSTLDRLKSLYEQYFLGIQKQAPAFIHSDVERKLRDLAQLNIRNTGLRYRLATLQQKFGSYNSYWRRTLRQIENGTYVRNLAKIGREAARTGSAIPEEILAAMPKRMRDQVLRDREQALAVARRRQQLEDDAAAGTTADGAVDSDGLGDATSEDALAFIHDPTAENVPSRRVENKKTASGAHILSEDDAEIDFNALFSAFDDDAPKSAAAAGARTKPPTQPPRSGAPAQPPRNKPGTLQPASRPQVPRMPVPTAANPPPGPLDATGPIPLTATPTQTSAIPRPNIHAASGPHTAPRTATANPAGPPGAPRPPGASQTGPTQAVPRAIGQQPSGPTQAVPRPVGQQPSGPTHGVPHPVDRQPSVPSGAVVRPPGVVPPTTHTGPVPVAQRQTGPLPTVTQAIPRPGAAHAAPSQQTRPNPIVPGAAAQTGPVPVESMSGPFPRLPSEKTGQPPPPPTGRTGQTQAIPREVTASASGPTARTGQTQAIPRPAAPLKPPPGMTDADVNALHAKYVKAKQMIGEKVDPGSREKLLKTIQQTAPKIMEKYKASGVDFSVVVKDNQVVIKAKPKI